MHRHVAGRAASEEVRWLTCSVPELNDSRHSFSKNDSFPLSCLSGWSLVNRKNRPDEKLANSSGGTFRALDSKFMFQLSIFLKFLFRCNKQNREVEVRNHYMAVIGHNSKRQICHRIVWIETRDACQHNWLRNMKFNSVPYIAAKHHTPICVHINISGGFQKREGAAAAVALLSNLILTFVHIRPRWGSEISDILHCRIQIQITVHR